MFSKSHHFFKMKELSCVDTYVSSSGDIRNIDVSIGGSAVGTLSDVQVKDSAGAVGFATSKLSTFQNRFMIWRSSNNALIIEEHSIDTYISKNLIKLTFEHARILPGIDIVRGNSCYQLLVSTTLAVHRVCMSDKGSSLVSSITQDVCTSVGSYATIDSHTSMPYASAAMVKANDEALFALAYNDGSIHLICMPKIDTQPSGVVRTVLQCHSTARRLLSGLIGRGWNEESACKGPTDVIIFNYSTKSLLAAVFSDMTLRLWDACKGRELTSVSLALFLSENAARNATDISYGVECRLRQLDGVDRTTLLCHCVLDGTGKFIILSLSEVRGQIHLSKVMQIDSEMSRLVDIRASSTCIWGVWLDDSSNSLVRKMSIDLKEVSHCDWKDVSPPSSPIGPIIDEGLGDNVESLDSFYIQSILQGSFSMQSIARAFKVYCKLSPILATSNLEVAGNEIKRVLKLYDQKQTSRNRLARVDGCVDAKERQHLWNSIFSSCIQYLNAGNNPLSLLFCPNIHLYGLIRMDHFGVFMEDDGMIDTLELDLVSNSNNSIWLDCVQELGACITHEQYNAYIQMLINNYTLRELGIKMNLNYDPAHLRVQEIRGRMSGVLDFMAEFLDALLQAVDAHVQFPVDFEKLLVNKDAVNCFSSPLSISLLAAGVRELIRSRLRTSLTAINLINLCHNWFQKRIEGKVAELGDKLVQVAKYYSCLEYLFTPFHMRKQFSKVVTDVHNENSHKWDDILRFYLDSQQKSGKLIRSVLVETVEGEGYDKMDWTYLSSRMVSLAISTLWPTSNTFLFFDNMINMGKTQLFIEYIGMLKPWPTHLSNCFLYYKGRVLVELGWFEEAFETLLQAAEGATSRDPLFLSKLFPDIPDPVQSLGVSDYFLKVAALFEEKGEVHMLIRVIETALQQIKHSDDKNQARLWSVLFRTHMVNGDFEAALVSLQANPDTSHRENCLRQLVNTMSQHGHAAQLAKFHFGDLRSQVIDLMQSRARCADITDVDGYQLLHAVLVNKCDYRRAAQCMYEWSCRLRAEYPTQKGVPLRVQALSTSLADLGLIDSKYAWLIKSGQQTSGARSPKRDYDGEESGIGGVQIVTEQEIREEFSLQQARLQLLNLNKNKSKGEQWMPSDTADMLITELLEEYLFDVAALISVERGLSLEPVVSALTTECVRVSRHSDAGKPSSTLFMQFNQVTVSDSGATRTSGQCWRLLCSFIETYSAAGQVPLSRMLSWTAETMLQLQYPLPGWLVVKLQKMDIGEYVRLLIMYDHLELAQDLIMQYIQAVLDSDKAEKFNLKDTVRPGSLGVWLPYTAIDSLSSLLGSRQVDSVLTEKYEKLESMMHKYFDHLEQCCVNK